MGTADLLASPIQCRFVKVGEEDTYESARSLPVYINQEFKVNMIIVADERGSAFTLARCKKKIIDGPVLEK